MNTKNTDCQLVAYHLIVKALYVHFWSAVFKPSDSRAYVSNSWHTNDECPRPPQFIMVEREWHNPLWMCRLHKEPEPAKRNRILSWGSAGLSGSVHSSASLQEAKKSTKEPWQLEIPPAMGGMPEEWQESPGNSRKQNLSMPEGYDGFPPGTQDSWSRDPCGRFTTTSLQMKTHWPRP